MTATDDGLLPGYVVPGGPGLRRTRCGRARRPPANFDILLSSTLLEAEFRFTLAREGVGDGERVLQAVSWILPDRRLTAEIDRILTTGYVRGTDLQHLACALYAAESPRDLTFLTLDDRQREIAAALSFPT